MARPFNVLPVSYSSMDAYNACPKQFYELRVIKRWKQEPSPQMDWGNAVHKALENNIKFGHALPPNMASYQWGLNAVQQRRPTTVIKAELDVAMTEWRLPTGFWDDDAWARGKIDVFVSDAGVTTALNGDWKGLPLETPLPTPRGWATMGEVAVGERLIDMHGIPCIVVGKSQVKQRECYRVTFDDVTTAECDDEHLWKLHDGSVVPVTELRYMDKILVSEALKLPRAKLPLDPYVLGVWLADGKHTSGEMTKPDVFIWEEIERRGFALGVDSASARGSCRTQTILGIRGLLKEIGVLGNKHIPLLYLRASRAQRLELLQGLMDGDGSANHAREQVVLDGTNEALVRGVHELALSLGQRAVFRTFTGHGFGKDVTVHQVTFSPIGISPFKLPRKAEKVAAFGRSVKARSWCRRVKAVERIGVRSTQCVSVNSPTNTYLCTRNFTPTHNTGKTKPNSKQLVLSTLLCFANWPTLEKVRTTFFWLPEQDPAKRTTQQLFIREDDDHVCTTNDRGKIETTTIADLWEPFNETVEKMKWSQQNDVWPANPSGLCKAWCPVLDCPHNGKRVK